MFVHSDGCSQVGSMHQTAAYSTVVKGCRKTREAVKCLGAQLARGVAVRNLKSIFTEHIAY